MGSHHAIIESNHTQAIQGLSLTIILGVYFSILQAYEYIEASFTIADSVYGTTFYVATGFHGLHVLIGTTFLAVCLYRLSLRHNILCSNRIPRTSRFNWNNILSSLPLPLYKCHFSPNHHFGFEAAA